MMSIHANARAKLLALLCLAGTATSGLSGDLGRPGGTFAFESLRRPSTASEAVFGGSCDPEAGPEAVRSNPAALSGTLGLTLAASHQSWQTDLQEQWTGVSFPIPGGGASMEVSAFHAGSLEAFSPDGVSLGSFRPVEFLAGLGAGVNIRPGLRAGLSVHGLYLGSDGSRLTGMSMGGGLEWDVSAVVLGVAARNMGAGPKGEQGVYRLPAEFTLTARSDARRRATLGLGATRDRDGEMRGTLASRVRLHGGVSLMAGMRYEGAADAGPVRGSAGLEVQLGALEVGYALTPGDELGSGHVVSVRFTRMQPERSTAVSAAPVPAPVSRPVPPSGEPAIPAPATYVVWGGLHRSPASATAEIRALRAQKVLGADVIALDDGTYRVRIARHLQQEEASRLAQRIQAIVEVE